MATLNFVHRLRTRARSDRGAEIIEFAIVTPILAMLIAAMFDFGFMFRNWELVTNAAREGARVGILPDYACDGSTNDIADRIDKYMTASGVADSSLYSISLNNKAVDTVAGTFNACIVTVTMPHALPTLSVFTSLFGNAMGNIEVRGAAVMRTETQATAP